jgi:antitoxin VapB
MDKSTRPRTAKLFLNGRSQAVRLPAEFRFEGNEVLIWVDPKTENVVLSRRPASWDDFFKLRKDSGKIPADFLSDRQDDPPQARDLF